jgi:hypothetical protein
MNGPLKESGPRVQGPQSSSMHVRNQRVCSVLSSGASDCRPNQMTGDGETVTPLLPEPGVWTGMA